MSVICSMSKESALTDVVLVRAIHCFKQVDSEKKDAIREVLTLFLKNEIDYVTAKAKSEDIIGDAYPVNYMQSILSVSDNPLPAPTEQVRSIGNHTKTRSWTADEDFRLIAGIHKFGMDNWQQVANFVGSGRLKNQCHQRWARGLDPKIDKTAWTKDEDEKLLMLTKVYGEKAWTRIATCFPNRCDVQCRYRFNMLKKESDFEMKLRSAKETIQSNPAMAASVLGVPLKQPKTVRNAVLKQLPPNLLAQQRPASDVSEEPSTEDPTPIAQAPLSPVPFVEPIQGYFGDEHCALENIDDLDDSDRLSANDSSGDTSYDYSE